MKSNLIGAADVMKVILYILSKSAVQLAALSFSLCFIKGKIEKSIKCGKYRVIYSIIVSTIIWYALASMAQALAMSQTEKRVEDQRRESNIKESRSESRSEKRQEREREQKSDKQVIMKESILCH
jgi:mannitol-specific phosphotransferase system IIBC component